MAASVKTAIPHGRSHELSALYFPEAPVIGRLYLAGRGQLPHSYDAIILRYLDLARLLRRLRLRSYRAIPFGAAGDTERVGHNARMLLGKPGQTEHSARHIPRAPKPTPSRRGLRGRSWFPHEASDLEFRKGKLVRTGL